MPVGRAASLLKRQPGNRQNNAKLELRNILRITRLIRTSLFNTIFTLVKIVCGGLESCAIESSTMLDWSKVRPLTPLDWKYITLAQENTHWGDASGSYAKHDTKTSKYQIIFQCIFRTCYDHSNEIDNPQTSHCLLIEISTKRCFFLRRCKELNNLSISR